MGIINAVYKFFQLKERETNIKTEFFAGFAIFLAMLYAIPVNAEILSHAGMPKGAIVTAVILITALATFATGIYANTPIAMSVGMGLNTYFTYEIVENFGVPWQQALGIVFASGVFFFIVSFGNFREWILKAIPINLRVALCVGIGVFLAVVGLKGIGFFVLKNDNLLLGNIKDPQTILAIFGILLILVLYVKKVLATFILGIAIVSIVGFSLGFAEMPKTIISLPASLAPIAFELDIVGILKFSFIPIILSLMIADLFDSLGTLSAVGVKAKMFQKDEDEDLVKTLRVDALATMGGSVLGVSTTTSFLESVSGVAQGGKTGLTAVFTALFFLSTLFFLPLFLSVPSFAIYPILVVVGCAMFLEIGKLDFADLPSSIASFFVIVLMSLTTSISAGLSAGFLVYLLLCITLKQWNRINLGLLFICALSAMYFIL